VENSSNNTTPASGSAQGSASRQNSNTVPEAKKIPPPLPQSAKQGASGSIHLPASETVNVPPVRKEENTIGAQVQVREWSQSSFDVAVPSQEALPVDEEDAEEREDFHQDVVIQRPRARRLTLSGNDMCVVSAGQERRLSRPVSVIAALSVLECDNVPLYTPED